IEIFFPINNNVKLNGLIFLGAKSNKEAYTIEDIQFLRTIMLNTAVALSRALLYFEVENFNNTLKSKVDEATTQIRSQKDALSETLRKERDMLDILAHELRTPLTIGKNAIKVIKDKSNTGMVPKEELDKYVELAENNLDREAKLLETMLTTTKIEHGEIKLSFQKIDINDLITRSIKSFDKKAKEKNLQVNFTPKVNYFLYADPSRMKEILDNLLDNAIKYTEKGTITIQTVKSDPFISISIIDTGVGIPAEEIPKLGNKFYRVNTYVKSATETGYTSVRAGGTGLGLFVVYNLVKAMNGKVTVSSEVGRGSNFTVNIPAYTNQKIDESESKGEKLYERFERMKQEKNKNNNATITEAVN
ncbi:HAMP domain-containing histidine kinase, partial [Candidatus Dojkabacteria bacterium]|nr:HAMP domain-containing histidine kinase [Candidatus Dojkabacteria bacterium]